MSTLSPYNKGIQYLRSLERLGIHLGLARMKTLLKSLGNPQDKLSIIHIGGTNGKGSTSAMIASVLTKAGYKVGLYTSPHLVRINERIRIDGKEIADKTMAELVEKVRRGGVAPPPQPTFFEFTTAMAFLYFAEQEVDFAVMEVGLGGRLDATNVGRPLVSVITNISKDHEAMLGRRVEDIAFEKAGIVKKNGILISAETKPATLKVLTAACKRKRAVFYRLNKDFFIAPEGTGDRFKICPPNSSILSKSVPNCRVFSFKGRRWILKGLKINLLGRHQYFNAACAIAALEVLQEKGFCIPETAVKKGLQDVFWPGRLEIVSKRPLIVLDCAHNPAGAEVLKETLKNEFNYKRLILVSGIMADKDIQGIFSRLAPLAHTVLLTRPQIERAASLDVLYKKIKPYANKVKLIESVKDVCGTAVSMSSSNDMICITGSVFTVGEAREFLVKGQR